MFHLVYNIDFELSAFVFAVLLFAETCCFYPSNTKKNQIFRLMALLVIMTEGFDIASAFTITYGSMIPKAWNLLINTGYFSSGIFLCFIFQYYIEKAVVPPEGKSVLLKTNMRILIVVEISIFINLFFGYYFSFSAEGEYLHGALYLVMHLMSAWFVVCASTALIINRKWIKKSQFFSSLLFIALFLSAMAVQTLVIPDILILMPTVSIMLVITIFSLESPDFIQLQKTLAELTATKQELEAANQKYYDLAYKDQMTGLRNRSAYNDHLEALEKKSSLESTIFLILDINNLKMLNDTYGHLTGDDAIIRAAGIMKNCFPEEEIYRCYRIGGDEFAMISEHAEKEDFLKNLDHFSAAVQKEGEKLFYPFALASGYRIAEKETLLEIVKKADEAMYENKIKMKAHRGA